MNSAKVLLVEDDDNLREALIDTLSLAGFQWIDANNGEQALLLLKKNTVDIVVSDVQMAGMDGLNLLRSIKQHYPQLPVLLITAYANIEDAVLAMKEGAVDYMAKPFAPELLLTSINRYLPENIVANVANSHALPLNNRAIPPDNHAALENKDTIPVDKDTIPIDKDTIPIDKDTIAVDAKSQALLSLAYKVAKTDANVLILGESGTGKEVLAKYIHRQSKRHAKPFIAINCAAIPENMLEATLFGYEKGAFTGAIAACAGKFELAQEGTILLDEISEMELGLQAKLLRVLQEREVERLGARKSIKLNVRVLATSNRDLRQYVEQGNFREDLYYRLNVFPLILPALCERVADILPIAQHLLQSHCEKQGLSTPVMDKACQKKLLAYQWPGNVRELDNVMQRALILCQQECISAESVLLEGVDWQHANGLQQLVSQVAQTKSQNENFVLDSSLGGELKAQEFSIILAALEACKGQRKEVAERLGISARTLRYKLAKMREAGINIPS